jgi:hypothetical protein
MEWERYRLKEIIAKLGEANSLVGQPTNTPELMKALCGSEVSLTMLVPCDVHDTESTGDTL